MRVTVNEVVRAFEVLYEGIHDSSFRKTLPLNSYGERALAPLVRTFLLGWFGRVAPEQRSSLPTSLTGKGSIDFVVGNVAVEFAVRRPKEGRTPLSDVTNATEIIKLMRHDGPALLVLYDLSPRPLDREALERYRRWKSLGQGNHKKSAFNVAYFYRQKGKPITNSLIRLNVRPPKRR